MGQILSSSALNNLQVDGAYVYIQPPQSIAGLGIPTSLSGIVGTASWGPLNTALPFSDAGSLYATFGTMNSAGADTFSLVTEGQFACAYSNSFLGVRVSDGTDVAASLSIKDTGNTNGIKFTAFYTGGEGNNISVALQTGGNSTVSAPTLTIIVSRQGYPAEVFPNIANATGGGFQALAIAAINNGMSGVRGPSRLVIAAQLTAPSTVNYAVTTGALLTGGTNGSGVSSTQQIGTDGTGSARTGIYALRGTGVQQFILAGNSDKTQYAALATFAGSEGSLAICALPASEPTTTALTDKQTGNLNSIYAALIKDWVYFTDPTTGANRLVSPLGVALGVTASLPPEASPSNKPINGVTNILYTDRMLAGPPYSAAEASQLEQAGIMYMTRPMSRGNLIGFANGQNSSGVFNSGTDTVAYTRMTNFLGASIAGMLGQYVGELQSSSANDPTRAAAKATLDGFLQTLKDNQRIAAFNVQLDNVINTATTIAQGYCLAYVTVQYMAVIKFFLATLQGGQSVQISTGVATQV